MRAKILVAMGEKIEYSWSKSSLKTILYHLNFKYRNGGRRFFMERNSFTNERGHFWKMVYRHVRGTLCNSIGQWFLPLYTSWKLLKGKYKEIRFSKMAGKKSLHFSLLETLCELREKVKLTMPKEKKYKLDGIA